LKVWKNILQLLKFILQLSKYFCSMTKTELISHPFSVGKNVKHIASSR
jgi:hypothetical protein